MKRLSFIVILIILLPLVMARPVYIIEKRITQTGGVGNETDRLTDAVSRTNLTLTYDGSNQILTSDVGGANFWSLQTSGAFLQLYANPNPSNDYLMFTVSETQGADTEINFYEGGTGHNRFWSSGSARFGGEADSMCSNLTTAVDCDTALTGADVVIEDDLWVGGKIYAFETNFSAGGADGTGGWTNTSTHTSTDLIVNVSKIEYNDMLVLSGNATTGTEDTGVRLLLNITKDRTDIDGSGGNRPYAGAIPTADFGHTEADGSFEPDWAMFSNTVTPVGTNPALMTNQDLWWVGSKEGTGSTGYSGMSKTATSVQYYFDDLVVLSVSGAGATMSGTSVARLQSAFNQRFEIRPRYTNTPSNGRAEIEIRSDQTHTAGLRAPFSCFAPRNGTITTFTFCVWHNMGSQNTYGIGLQEDHIFTLDDDASLSQGDTYITYESATSEIAIYLDGSEKMRFNSSHAIITGNLEVEGCVQYNGGTLGTCV